MLPQRTRRRLRNLALLVLAIVATGVSHERMDHTPRLDEDEIAIPGPTQARLFALGFDAALADWYWLQALQFVGGEMGSIEKRGERVARFIEMITAVDPWVGHPYRFAAVWLVRTPELVERANHLLERAISYHPLDWRNRYHLGFNHFFYLENRLQAVEVLESAIGLDGAPNYLAPLVARLRADGGGLQVAGAFLARMAETADDEYARAEYLKALDEIEVERRARFLDAAREEFWNRRGRDIQRVSELVEGPNAVLPALPPAHIHLPGFEWVLDEKTRTIVSSFYRSRYELHVTPSDRARQERWRKLRAGEDPGAAGEGA